jgi:hypothetical protein
LHHCKPMLRVWRYHYMRLSNNVWEVIFIEHFDQLCLLFSGNVLTILNVEGSHQDIHPGLDLHPICRLWFPLEEVLHTHIAISMQPIAHQIKQSKQVKSSQVESTPKATITVQCTMPPTNQPLHSQIMSHEVESCQITWCHMSCQINPCDMPNEFMCQVKSSQVKSDEITHGQINHDQFKSCAKWCLRGGGGWGVVGVLQTVHSPQASHLHE